MATNKFLVTRTKIIVPRRRSELLSRQRLLDLLSELLDGKLTIVAAPAGYGKTSLLIDFINPSKIGSHQIEMPVCWFSLDPLDRDPLRFLAHFIASLSLRFTKFGKNSQLALDSITQDQLDLDGITSTIVNDLYDNVSEHFAIFLDDYHLVGESKPVEAFINRFVQDVDENCHIVIASRALLTLPDMPLMVARSQVSGLSFEELAFRPEEIQKLLKQNYQMNLSWGNAQDMVQQTEGWITGLLLSTQIAGQSIQERVRASRVSGIGLYEYLTQQILDLQPPDIQDFLLRTSLLEEFDASLCAQVIAKALDLPNLPWDHLMDAITRGNLFILPVGEDGRSLRYHHLFRDFLQTKITRERPDEASKIRSRLAQVYVERGEWEHAYELYQQLGQIDAMADLVEIASAFMIPAGRIETLTQWMETLTADIIAARPGLISIQGTIAITRGNSKHGLSLLNQAISILRSTHSTDHLLKSLVRRSTANRLLGNYQLAVDDADEVLTAITDHSERASLEAEAWRAKGISLYNLGNLGEALASMEKGLSIFKKLGDEREVAILSMEIGMAYKSLGQYEAAEEAYNKALDLWQITGNSTWQANLLNNLGVLQHLQGKYETAAGSLERAVQHARHGANPRLEAFSLTSLGDLYRDLQSNYEAAEAYQQARKITEELREPFLSFYLYLAEIWMARSNQQTTQVNTIIEAAYQQALNSGSNYDINLCRLERGRGNFINGAFEAAFPDLKSSSAFFKEEGYRVEASQALLLLAAATFHTTTGETIPNSNPSEKVLNELFALVPDKSTWQPLIPTGREIKSTLVLLQNTTRPGRLVTDLLNAIALFEQDLVKIRHQLRRKAIVLPAGPPRLSIRALGRMQIKVNDHLVSSTDWRQIIARDIIFLLLAYPNGLNKEEIGQIFWPEASFQQTEIPV